MMPQSHPFETPTNLKETMNTNEPAYAAAYTRIAEKLIDVSCIILLSILAVRFVTQIHLINVQHSQNQPTMLVVPAPDYQDSESKAQGRSQVEAVQTRVLRPLYRF